MTELANIKRAKAKLAEIGCTEMELAKIDPDMVEIAKIEIAKIDLAKIDFAKIELAKIELAKIELAKIELVKIDPNIVEIAKIELAKIERNKIKLDKIGSNMKDIAKTKCDKIGFTEIKVDEDGGKRLADTILDRIKAVERVNAAHTWANCLTMAYHYEKHKCDFGGQVSLEDYFGKYPSELFADENRFKGALFGQWGSVRNAYYRAFRSRRHVGFSYRTPSDKKIIITTHYVK